MQRPDASGRFGKYGGKYVPETLITALAELEAAYAEIKSDPAFQVIGKCTHVVQAVSYFAILFACYYSCIASAV